MPKPCFSFVAVLLTMFSDLSYKGIALIITVLQIVRIPNLKVILQPSRNYTLIKFKRYNHLNIHDFSNGYVMQLPLF